MSVAVRQEQLGVLVEVSRRMHESAMSGDWEAVDHSHEIILQLAGNLFAETIATEDVAVITESVNKVITSFKSVVDMGVEARDGCLKGMDKLHQGRRAVKEYTTNTK